MDSMKNLMNKVSGTAREHPDQTGRGIDRMSEEADRRTGGKYSGHIDKGADRARRSFGGHGGGGRHGGGTGDDRGGGPAA
ncbi:antitoxin [Streptomyces pactum]|uniref:Antitoxin n=1 Tax=Streptomyces pactum TaxID=68249 RepID=A0ABS0NHE5_9ACTN|nr:antitoxin [Streptomyces pactum]MBH5334610.1 antitoxin [Streptomyces pactum]MBH5338856.1 antitoxin [Streptomyces pactum]